MPNDFGLHDMHGNVSEYCQDWYQEDFYQDSKGAKDPVCDSVSMYRVRRGGTYHLSYLDCRSTTRIFTVPSTSGTGYGFRPTWSSP